MCIFFSVGEIITMAMDELLNRADLQHLCKKFQDEKVTIGRIQKYLQILIYLLLSLNRLLLKLLG